MKKIQGISEYHNILFHLIKIIFYCQVNFVKVLFHYRSFKKYLLRFMYDASQL